MNEYDICSNTWEAITHQMVISCLMHTIETTTSNALNDGLGKFVENYKGTARALAVLSVVLIGWIMMTGKSETYNTRTLLWTMIMIGVVLWIIENLPALHDEISPLFTRVPAEIASSITFTNTNTEMSKKGSHQELDKIFAELIEGATQLINIKRVITDIDIIEQLNNKGIDPKDRGMKIEDEKWVCKTDGGFWANLTPGNIGSVLVGVLVLIMAALYMILVVGILVMNQVRVTFLLVFSPLFISLYLFQRTRDMTVRWIQNLVTCILIATFTYSVIMVNANIVNANVKALSATCETPFMLPVAIALTMGASFMIVSSIPDLAKDISGSGGGGELFGKAGAAIVGAAATGAAMAVTGPAGMAAMGATKGRKMIMDRMKQASDMKDKFGSSRSSESGSGASDGT